MHSMQKIPKIPSFWRLIGWVREDLSLVFYCCIAWSCCGRGCLIIGETSSWFGDLNLTMWIDTRMQKDLSLTIDCSFPFSNKLRTKEVWSWWEVYHGKGAAGVSILDVGAWLKKNIPHIARMDDPGNPQKNPMIHIWMFPKIGIPQNGWFIMENPIKMG